MLKCCWYPDIKSIIFCSWSRSRNKYQSFIRFLIFNCFHPLHYTKLEFLFSEYCIPLLEKNKYCRFNKDSEAQDSNRAVEVGDVLVLFNHKIMQFHTYISLKQSSSQVNFVTEYASFVGNKLCKRLLLLLK